ncbi:hypothetical protein Y032_0044g1060 [Ancylostoma ceylanicum]|uniref:Uncharacterized protein n=1 Tax=Ancylostoma ceylanicum TaxID=53326 RepID=A0A016UEG1_9BILA|nr:hypothetical protein Y032_0044g1060 [Ancylostoma ceylanicum]
MRIQCLVSIQQQREREREDERRMRDRPSGEATPVSTSSTFMQTVLPRLTLPKFSGKRQEWDMFWALFKTNIDEQPISSMMKYNYLLQALTGEARQVAGRYQFIEENYNIVVNALKQKYGRDSSIVEELLAEFERCKASGPSTRQQIALLDHIAAIVQQLSSKEALNKKPHIPPPPPPPPPPPQPKTSTGRPISQCIYCKGTSHRSAEYRKVPESERKAFLVRNQL